MLSVYVCFLVSSIVNGRLDGQLERVLELHRAGREAIQTLECQVHFSRFDRDPVEGPALSRGRYHRLGTFLMSGKRKLATYLGPGELTSQYLADDGLVFSFSAEDNSERGSFASLDTDRGLQLADTDALFGGQWLVDSFAIKTNLLPLEQAAKLADRRELIADAEVKGQLCKVIRLTSERSMLEGRAEPRMKLVVDYYLNPIHNYLIVRTHCQMENTLGVKVTIDHVTEEVTDIAGMALPVKTVRRIQQNEPDFATEHRWHFTKIKVNESIPAERFALRLPHGTKVRDLAKSVVYEVDTTGKRIAPDVPVTRKPPLTRDPTNGGQQVRPINIPTQAEPPSSWGTLFLVSLGVLLVAVAISVYRKWRPD